jgi:hypothetical protein
MHVCMHVLGGQQACTVVMLSFGFQPKKMQSLVDITTHTNAMRWHGLRSQVDAATAGVISPRDAGKLREQLDGLRETLPEDILRSIAISPTRGHRYSMATELSHVEA